ncbi:MAG TPA: hypothetical protein VGB11_02245 [Candidatus Bathyarchaeia archaeon]
MLQKNNPKQACPTSQKHPPTTTKKKLKPEDFTTNMRQPNLIDGRRIYNPQEFSQKLKFKAIGRGH